jgi:hypothetical protein
MGAAMSVDGNGSGGEPNGSAPSVVESAQPGTDEALTTAQTFIEAVVWGDHEQVWSFIGAEGRTEVLEVATKRGMDEGLAARLAADSASPSEKSEFLADLVNGLRSELAGNDLEHLTYELDTAETEGDRAAVVMHVPLHPLLGGTLPVGTLYLAVESGTWRVERLIPLTSK